MPQTLAKGTDVTSLMSGTDVTALMSGAGRPAPTITPGASPAQAVSQANAGLWGGDPMAQARPQVPTQMGMVGSAVSGAASTLNPIQAIKALFQAFTSPIETLKGLAGAQRDEYIKAKALFDQKRYSEAAGHLLAAGLPVLGPPAAAIGEQMGQGLEQGDMASVANALGQTAATVALVKPSIVTKPVAAVVKPIARAAQTLPAVQAAAGRLRETAVAKVADVMAPKVGRQKQRWGIEADRAAKVVLDDPSMPTAFSRTGLERQVTERLREAEAQLDAAHKARPAGELYETEPIAQLLEEKIKDLQALPAEGEAAYAQLERMGLNMPPGPPPVGTPFKALKLAHKEELRRLVEELKEFRYQERIWLRDQGEAVAREGGYGTGRGARASRTTPSNKPFIDAVPGAEVYYDVLQDKTGISRGQMIKSLERYIAGEGPYTPIVRRAMQVADDRLRDPSLAKGAALPLEAGQVAEDWAQPIGEAVTPAESAARVRVLRQKVAELRRLGPAVTYDNLMKLRQAADKGANYTKSVLLDRGQAISSEAAALGSQDAAGALRDAMAVLSPEVAKANAPYAAWRNAQKVLKATAEVERTRPVVGRKLVARMVGTIEGGRMGGGLGAAMGYALAPIVDTIVSSGPTTQIMTARILDRLAKAIQKGDVGEFTVNLKKLRAATLVAPAVNAAGERGNRE